MSYLVYCSVLLCVFSYNHRIALSSPTTYDQRQNGDINVQIHLKDVQVVALLDSDLLDDYTDYDYPYDYADFTIKPAFKPTTSTTTVAPITSSSATEADNQQTTEKPPTSGSTPTTAAPSVLVSESPASNTTEEKVVGNGDAVDTDEKKAIIAETSSAPSTKISCPRLHVFDKKQGRCRMMKNRRRYSLVPLNLRLGSRPTREREEQDEDLAENTKDLPIKLYKSQPIKQ